MSVEPEAYLVSNAEISLEEFMIFLLEVGAQPVSSCVGIFRRKKAEFRIELLVEEDSNISNTFLSESWLEPTAESLEEDEHQRYLIQYEDCIQQISEAQTEEERQQGREELEELAEKLSEIKRQESIQEYQKCLDDDLAQSDKVHRLLCGDEDSTLVHQRFKRRLQIEIVQQQQALLELEDKDEELKQKLRAQIEMKMAQLVGKPCTFIEISAIWKKQRISTADLAPEVISAFATRWPAACVNCVEARVYSVREAMAELHNGGKIPINICSDDNDRYDISLNVVSTDTIGHWSVKEGWIKSRAESRVHG